MNPVISSSAPATGPGRILSLGLFLCLSGGVLAFGGMESLSFHSIQLVVFLLVGVALWSEAEPTRVPWKGPALLLAYLIPHSWWVGKDSFAAQEYLLRFLAYVGVFCLTAVLARDQATRHRLALALVGLGLFESLYGLVQYLSGWQKIFTYQKIYYTEQATGTYINANHFAGFLEMILPLCFAGFLYRCRVPAAGLQAKLPGLVFFFFSSLLLFGGILFSLSRTGIFSAAVALVGVGLLWRGAAGRRRSAGLLLGGFLAVTLFFGLWIGLDPVLKRYERVGADYGARLAIWRDTVALIREQPLLGSGLGNYVHAYPRVQTTSLTRVVDHAHNDYLEIASEWGLVGATLLFGLVVAVWLRAVQAYYRSPVSRSGHLALGCAGGILALLLHSVADFNLHIPGNALVFAAVLGLSYSISERLTGRRVAEKTMVDKRSEPIVA